MRAHSIDLRQKVINFIAAGHSQKQATEIFKLNKATVNRWWIRYKREGHLNARKNLGSKGKIDRISLTNYVNKYPNSTLHTIGIAFKVSYVSIYKCLKQLGYSYKKKPTPMWKQTRKDENSI